MVAPLRHRQTKEAETDMFDLKPPRHISTLHEGAPRVPFHKIRLLRVLRTHRGSAQTAG